MDPVEKPVLASPDAVIAFWREAGPERWFAKDETFDALCRARFGYTWEAAARGDLADWEKQAEGSLALLILLDQMPRNMFRGTRDAYKTDAAALMVAERAIEKGHDREVDPAFRRFFYLPFMHSEELRHQERSVALNEAIGDPDAIQWARHHHDIIRRFGRFPHRNAVLGRETTPEETRFLEEDAFRG